MAIAIVEFVSLHPGTLNNGPHQIHAVHGDRAVLSVTTEAEPAVSMANGTRKRGL